MAKATASPPARRRSGDRPRGKAKTPKHKTKETSPPKHESAWKHEINRGFIAPFLLTRSVHFLAAIWHNLSPPLTKSLFATRPIFHKLDETIRGHVSCSFLALVLKKELEDRITNLGKVGSWPEILADLNSLTETA